MADVGIELQISTAVVPRFQDAKYTAVASFVFLRYFCPAIVAPDMAGLVTQRPPPDLRRGLTLVAKIIQNLANNVLFGTKESFMLPLNDFLAENVFKVFSFLREVSAPVSPVDVDSSGIECFDLGACVSLHRFLYEHGDQVRQRLASQERRGELQSPSENDGPASRGAVKTLVKEIGPLPIAVTWNKPQVQGSNSLPACARFHDFMTRNSFRSAELGKEARAVYEGGENKVRRSAGHHHHHHWYWLWHWHMYSRALSSL